MDFLKKHSRLISILTILTLTVIGLAIRLTTFNKGDFWLDEAFTGIFVRAGWQEMMNMIAIDFVHPPLYYTVTKIWTTLLNSTSVETIRLLSVVLGTSLIPLSYLFMNKLLKGKNVHISLSTAFIFCINPFYISYSTEARSYAMLAVLGLLTVYLFLDIIRSKRVTLNRNYLLFVLLSILLVSTHYISTVFLLSLGIGYLIVKTKKYDFKGISESMLDLLKLFLPSVLTVGIIILGYTLIRRNIMEDPSFTMGVGWIPQATFTDIPQTIYNFFFGVKSQTLGMPPSNTFVIPFLTPKILGIGLTVLYAVGIYIYLGEKRKFNNIVFLLSISILPILLVVLLSYIGTQMYIERYMIMFGVGLVLLLLFLFQVLGKYALLIFLLLYTSLVLLISPTAHTSVYSDICKEANGGDIVVDDPTDYMLITYYCDSSNTVLFSKNREYYKTAWLTIGYENVVNSMPEDIDYVVQKNEDTKELIPTSTKTQYGEITLHRVVE